MLKKEAVIGLFFFKINRREDYGRKYYDYIRMSQLMSVALRSIVVDDEQDICLLLSSYLRKKEIETVIATTIAEGLKLTREFQPDIIFLDNNLPDGSGIDSIELFRLENPKMKIVIISALTNLNVTAMNNGADHFLGKPISFDNIQHMLDEIKVGS